MIKIGIDARLYFQTGVGTYIRNLIDNLQEIAGKEIMFYVYIMREDASKIQFKKKNFIKREVNYRWHSLGEQIGFLKVLNNDNLDLMHFTYFSYPIFYKKPFIATIHDTTPLLFKTGKASTKNPLIYQLKHFLFKIVLANQVRNAKFIITPTKTVKSQLVEIYGDKYSKKIIPVYEGVDQRLVAVKENTLLKTKFKKPFFIYVGNFYPHKNVERLMKAFIKVNGDNQLVLIVPNDFFAKQLYRSIDLPAGKAGKSIQNKIVFYHNATPADLKFFYSNAQALIHPSLSEGFGLPLVEAAYFGCPVIGSNIEVFKELLDGEYLSFNPNDKNDINNKINIFLREKKKFNYSEILKKYSFAAMTKKTVELYKASIV